MAEEARFGAHVTGASGFVGRALLKHLRAPSVVRFGASDWEERLASTDLAGSTIFHLAGRTHSRGDARDFQRDNVEKTRALAQRAAAQGAARFVYLSSVKAQADESRDAPLGPGDAPEPTDHYGRSKLAAERALAQVAERANLPFVVVRSPLVLGAGARGNLRALMRLAKTPLPLPFAAIANRRTMVHVEDLARLLVLCGSRGAPGATYLAGSPEPLSTPRLVAAMRRAMGRPARLFGVPRAVLERGAELIGRGAAMRSLTRSLELDASATRGELNWQPAATLDDAIVQMTEAFLRERP